MQHYTFAKVNNMYQPSRSRRASKARNNDRVEMRHVVVHDYHDHSMDRPSLVPSDEEIDPKKRSGPRGGVSVPFPTKLHVMLSRVEAEGLTDIVGWCVSIALPASITSM